ncbi:hypothetical protein DN38_2948 [Vibrio cholerae]|nr:hypothetical protein DN38_2948 [Vibrio cholerae]
MAVNQLSISEISNTVNKVPQYSPVVSSDRPMGAKAVTAITVAPSSGHLVWVTMSVAACKRVRPFCVPIKIPSTTTIALSTNIPKAITSAPNEIRCRSILKYCMKMKVPSTVKSRIRPINSPERSPIKNSNTMITMATACPRLTTKPLTDLSTSLGWLYTSAISIPIGC